MLASDGPFCPYIHFADEVERPHAWSIPQRRFTHWLLVAVLDGAERIRVDQAEELVPAGATYLVQPGMANDLGSPTGSTQAWIAFDLRWDERRASHPQAPLYQIELGDRASFMQPRAREAFGIDLPLLVPKPLRPVFRDGVRDVVRTWKLGRPLAAAQAQHLLVGLLLTAVERAWREQRGDAALSVEARIRRAEALARQRLADRFDLDEFAAAAGFSRSRFCAVYPRLRGISPGAYLRQERMRLAADLLVQVDLPIARVGAMVGYPDATVFGRVFRAHHGASPGAWRQRRLAADDG